MKHFTCILSLLCTLMLLLSAVAEDSATVTVEGVGEHVTVTLTMEGDRIPKRMRQEAWMETTSDEPMTGEWETMPHAASELPADAQTAFDKAVEGLVGAEYVPVALMSTQVVAGTNYCILCQITPVVPNATPAWALVYIYASLDGNAEITNVYELYIDRHSTPVPPQG